MSSKLDLSSIPPAKAPALKPFPEFPGNSPDVPGTTLALAIEVESDGRIPDPGDTLAGRVACITVHLDCMDETVVYSTHSISEDTKAKISDESGMFIPCRDETGMLTRAIRLIGTVKPTYIYEDSRKDMAYLRDRAGALGLKIDFPDLDRMFRMYDRKFNDIYGKSGMARKIDILQKCAESRHEFKQQLKRMY